jgi:hypothetical protein
MGQGGAELSGVEAVRGVVAIEPVKKRQSALGDKYRE